MEDSNHTCEDPHDNYHCEDGYFCCCCCNSTGGCTANGLADHQIESMNFTSQMTLFKEIWEQWSELQQVLALYSLLRSSSTHATSAHLMMANMLYAHHSSEYMHHLFQQANDPVWVANMEVKCMEEGSLELQAEEAGGPEGSERRESGSSSERRESGSSGDRRASESTCDRRESGSSMDRRTSALSCDRQEDVLLTERRTSTEKFEGDPGDERLLVKSGKGMRESGCSGDGTPRESECGADADGDRIVVSVEGQQERVTNPCERRESRESVLSGVERRESGSSGGDRRESGGSGLSFEERRDSGESCFTDRQERVTAATCKLNLKEEKTSRERLYSYDNAEEGGTAGGFGEEKTSSGSEGPFLDTLNELLLHLPLLHTNNTETKVVYLAVIAKVVCISIRLSGASTGRNSEMCVSVAQRARQLVTYAMLHPCVTPQERKSLMACLHSLNSAGGADGSDAAGTDAQQKWSDLEGTSSGGEETAGPSVSRGGDDASQCGGGGGPGQDPGAALRPPPIREVCAWLKSLRLHKYDWLVRGLEYQQLLSLDDTSLEAKGVTKGARHKLLLSISRLGQRHQHLRAIEKEVQRGGLATLDAAVSQLKALVITPMPPPPPPPPDAPPTDGATGPSSSASTLLDAGTTAEGGATEAAHCSPSIGGDAAGGGVQCEGGKRLPEVVGKEEQKTLSEDPDLPTMFTRVLGKVVSAVVMGCGLESPASSSGGGPHLTAGGGASLVANVLWLLDKCLQHESFAAHHKRLWMWRSQLMLPPSSQGPLSSAYHAAAVNARHHRNRRWSHQLEYQQHAQQLQQHLLQQQFQQQQQQLLLGAATSGLTGLGALNMMSCLSPGGGGPRRMFRPPHILASPPQYPAMWGLIAAARPGFGGVPVTSGGLAVPPPSTAGAGLLSPQPYLGKRPSLQEPPSQLRPHVSLQRTRSAPSRPHQPLPCARPLSPGHTPPPHQLHPSPPSRRASHPDTALLQQLPHTAYQGMGEERRSGPLDDDITNRLESLCLSVTQHALE